MTAPPLQPFEANSFPLSPGLRLLEASAGTGKTFALAQLVLRLVAEARIDLPQLLVVTFTEAAAAELRDRIGRRLQQALAGLEDPQRPAVDPTLEAWLGAMAGRGRRAAGPAAAGPGGPRQRRYHHDPRLLPPHPAAPGPGGGPAPRSAARSRQRHPGAADLPRLLAAAGAAPAGPPAGGGAAAAGRAPGPRSRAAGARW
jgi:hypothetical protein